MFCMKKMRWIAVMLMATTVGFAEESDQIETIPASDEVATLQESPEGEESSFSIVTEDSFACESESSMGEETEPSIVSEDSFACESEISLGEETESSIVNTEAAVAFSEDSLPLEGEDSTVPGGVSAEALSRIVNVTSMTDEDLLAAVEGNAVLEFPTSSQLALQFFVDGDFLSFFGFTNDLGYLEVQETFYLGFPEEGGLVFSSNLTDWNPFLDFTGGDLSVFLAKEDENLVLNVDLLLNKRSV